MSIQSEQANSVSDIVKLTFSLLIVTLAISAFYVFSDFPLIARVLGLLLLLSGSVGLMFTTRYGEQFWMFMLEAKQEFRRISWPSKDEAVKTTLLVISMVFIVGLVLWLLDMFLLWGIQLLMSRGI